MVLVGFVLINCLLKHGIEDLVSNLNLTISLFIVRL